jgi:hypothetical protein
MSYSKAKHFEDHQAFLSETYMNQHWEKLVDLIEHLNLYMLRKLDIKTRLLYSSQLAVDGRKDDLVLNLCREVGASTYLSGPLGKDYLREQRFMDAGIRVRYHEYQHPIYRQSHDGFEEQMSIIDLLLNCNNGREVLLRNQEQPAL